MKNSKIVAFVALLIIIVSFSSCIIVDHRPGYGYYGYHRHPHYHHYYRW